MKLHKYNFTAAALIVAGTVIIASTSGCDQDHPASLFDPEYERTAPIITSIDPPSKTLAGVGIVTLTGSGFAPAAHENVVYFHTTKAQILNASPTQIQVVPPNFSMDSLHVKVGSVGNVGFSNEMLYALEAAAEEFGNLAETEHPYGLAFDAEGALYYSRLVDSPTGGPQNGGGIYRISPAGVRTEYVAGRGFLRYDAMKFGPDGSLYLARDIRLIARVPPGGGAEENWLPLPVGALIIDLDFDQAGYMWAVGNNAVIYRIQPSDGSFEAYPFEANSRSVRYFSGSLYILAKRTDGGQTVAGVWRLPLDGSSVPGNAEMYYELPAAFSGSSANAFALTIADDGTLYIGTNTEDAIIKVNPDKSSEPLYSGLVFPSNIAFTWAPGTDLYVSRAATGDYMSRIIRIRPAKASAPYYGF